MIRWRLGLLAAVWMLTAAPNCRIGPPPPPPGALNVPYYRQEDWQAYLPKLCGPATVKMWQSFGNGGISATQTTIWNWMRDNYPTQVGDGGASPTAIWGAAQQFVGGGGIALDYYALDDEKKQSVADITKNLRFNTPTIALISQGHHAVIVVGAQWRTLSPNQNPSLDALYIHDPLGLQFHAVTIGAWLQNMGTFCIDDSCMASIQRSGSRFFALPERGEFDWMGGVYYGPPPPGATGRYKVNGEGSCYWDANDSGPNQCSPGGGGSGRYKLDGQGGCYWDANDSGPDQCSPGANRDWSRDRLWRLAKVLFSRDAMRADRMRGVRPPRPPAAFSPVGATATAQSAVPTPPPPIPRRWSTRTADIIENVVAGMAVTGIDRHPRFGAIRDRSAWVVRDVKPVSRLHGQRGYYLVEIVDRQGRPMMTASVDTEGWLLAVGDARGRQPARAIAIQDAVTLVSHRRGAASVRAARYVSGMTTIEPGLGEFAPLALVERFDGTYYVNSAGHVFKEGTDDAGTFGSRPAVAVRGRVKALERVD
jgi:hypothetical protein